MDTGCVPTEMVAVTLFAIKSTMLTVAEPEFATMAEAALTVVLQRLRVHVVVEFLCGC